MVCKNVDLCPVFEKTEFRDGAKIKQLYFDEFCNRDFENCARYKVYKACGKVPNDLLPTDQEYAEKICVEHAGKHSK